MKIIRNLAAILLALALISNWSADSDHRLAEAAENAHHSCDHSACQAEIAILEAELEEAQLSCSLVLRIELELAPGLLGNWAQLHFESIPLEIRAEAAQDLAIGQNLCRSAGSEENFFSHLLACRIIVADLAPIQ